MAEGPKYTIAHVTHEAVEKVGGIGSVLEGMLTSNAYRAAVGRSILVGPAGGHHFESPLRRLGDHVTIKYSSVDEVDTEGWGRRFRPIEYAFNVRIAYGQRHYVADGDGRSGEADILLIDVSNPNEPLLNAFKTRLWERFGIDAARYQADWGFEEYCRLAEPAFYALSALLSEEELPCIVFAHENMGMCTALKATLDGGNAFRTIFHAHECASARHVVEHHAGHDTAFYNIMRLAKEAGQCIEDVFGSMQDNSRHALISRSHELDAIIAVGDPTAEELHFLSPEMRESPIDLVYNGIGVFHADADGERRSRVLMDQWAEQVVGYVPQILMTHVTRPVISKGLWRDLAVASAMDEELGRRGQKALYVLLACGALPRSYEQVNEMAASYGWPRTHREGYPDVVGPEVALAAMFKAFNESHQNIEAILVNQFGWTRQALGDAAPEDIDFADLRRATDVEFGQSTYEPFGIAHFEPLGSGAICIPSSVCGCASSYRHVLDRLGLTEADIPNVIIADYTQLNDGQQWTMDSLLNMTQTQRDEIGQHVAQRTAELLLERLPRNDADRQRLLETGARIAGEMDWDHIVRDGMLPLFERLVESRSE